MYYYFRGRSAVCESSGTKDVWCILKKLLFEFCADIASQYLCTTGTRSSCSHWRGKNLGSLKFDFLKAGLLRYCNGLQNANLKPLNDV